MTKEEILILSPFFFPEPISTGKYNGLVAQGLANRGASVSVICSYPIYPDWVPSRSAEELPGVLTLRGGNWVRYPKHPLLRRAILEPWYAAHCAYQMLMHGRRTNRILAIFPPSLFMLMVPLLARKGTNIIGIVHDLQGVYAARKSGLVSRALNKVITWVEKRAFQACDHLVFLSETMRDSTVEIYKINSQNTSIHYPFVTIPEDEGDAERELDEFFDSDLKSLVYSGALGEKQAPEKLAKFLVETLESHPNWQARIFSQGPAFDHLRATFTHDRLKFFPLVEARLLPALLRRSDVQIVPQESGTSEGSLPSKLPNIIAAGTRLLCITDPRSELEMLVKAYPAGIACVSWDSSALADAFARITTLPLVGRKEADALLNKFTLDGLVDRLLNTERKK